MPPSARTSSDGRDSSISSVRHDSAFAPALIVSVPTSCRRSTSDSSTIAVSGFDGAGAADVDGVRPHLEGERPRRGQRRR